MILTPTVFVLGAGASMEFGFPSGRRLVINVCERLKQRTSTINEQLLLCGFDKKQINAFRVALERSMQPSIDSFLEGRPEFMEVGKAAIACELIPYESERSLLRKPDEIHWYEYLFNKLNAKPNEFGQNTLSVITYNYDRSFEHFLFMALKHSYGLKDEKCADILRSIPVIHVHGQLGELPYFDPQGRSYTTTLKPDIISKCISSIRIIHEDFTNEPQFTQAFDVLMRADVICFLGFGYHRTNLSRLRINELSDNKRILGTGHGIVDDERPFITAAFNGKIELSPAIVDILEFFRFDYILK